MRKNLIIVSLMVLSINLTAYSQTYELDKLKQIPSVDEEGMKIISLSIYDMFKEIIKEPKNNLTIADEGITVYSYYDRNGGNQFSRVNPIKGKPYLQTDSTDLIKNNILYFYLTFDKNGNLILPDKIQVVSCRSETQEDRSIENVGLLGFELHVTEASRAKFSNVKLQRIATADINSLTGGLSPVSVKIPFKLSFKSSNPLNAKGKATINKGDRIYASIDGNYKGTIKQEQLIQLLKEQTNILDYTKGNFEFETEECFYRFYIDFNILRGMISSNQPSTFLYSTEIIKNFSSKGSKLKKS